MATLDVDITGAGEHRKSSKQFPRGQAGPWGGCREPLCPAWMSDTRCPMPDVRHGMSVTD